MNTKLDNCLFRFRPLDKTEEEDNRIITNLEKEREYFSTPIHFNDPFDTLLYVDKNRLLDKIKQELDKGLDDLTNGIDDFVLRKLMEFENDERNPNKNINRMLYYGNIIQSIPKVRAEFQKNIKEICFSSNIMSVLMWAHYANDHKGFCIAYDINKLKERQCFDYKGNSIEYKLRLKQVNYTNLRVDMTEYMYEYLPKYAFDVPTDVTKFMMEPPQKYLEELILTKADIWKYEEEWRLYSISETLLKPNIISYIQQKPKAIIVGTKTSLENIKKLKIIADKKKIDILKMEASDENIFKLNITKINDYEKNRK